MLGQLYDVAVLLALEKVPEIALRVGSIREESTPQRSVVSKLVDPVASVANRIGNAISCCESRILRRWPFGLSVQLTCEKVTGGARFVGGDIGA
jgi:hypothetical protein